MFSNPGEMHNMVSSSVFNVLRTLKKYNPDDEYYEAYKWHYDKNGMNFMDTYYMMQWIGANIQPQRILEVGSRTGISICQLLSSYIDYSKIERVVLVDIFAERGDSGRIKDNLQLLNIPTEKLSIREQSSLDALPVMIESKITYDYILVDGCHDKPVATEDLNNAVQLIEPGGYILFDDLTPDGCSLQDVWDEFKYAYGEKFKFMENHDGKGLGVAIRRNET
jgi:predicted O-methyltransferase YrrM